MADKAKHAISPTREEDYPEWYQQVIKAADLAENSPVRGCMVIKPWGWGIWENMQRVLDGMFKATGHDSWKRKRSTSKALPRNALWSRITGWSRDRTAGWCRPASWTSR